MNIPAEAELRIILLCRVRAIEEALRILGHEELLKKVFNKEIREWLPNREDLVEE